MSRKPPIPNRRLSSNQFTLKNSEEITKLLQEGLALHNAGKINDAVLIYEIILRKYADHFDALQLLATAYLQQKNPELALYFFEKALKINKTNAAVFNNRGSAFQELRRFNEALQDSEEALRIKPDYVVAFYNRGNALQGLNRFDEALQSYDQALSIKPDYAEVYNNKGTTLKACKRFNEALQHFEEALRIKPDYIDASWNKATLLILIGDYIEGWKLYETRLNEVKTKEDYYQSSELSWRGHEDIQGKTLLIYSEQGLGDTIQFVRYLKKVHQLGIKIILEVPNPLVSLISTFDIPMTVLERGQKRPKFDAYCPLLSLPYVFKTRVETIPASIPYLFSNKEKLENWKQKLGNKSQKRIGLVWSGNINHKNDHNRSIPLDAFFEVLKLPFEWHSLQKEYRDKDKEFLLAHSEIHRHEDELTDFSDTAALIECMDLVISVDTSLAHLAGAIGKEIWIMLAFIPDYRWMLDCDDSPWYPSAKLIRQDESRNWSNVLNVIKSNLLTNKKIH